jgi:hypothetical protein
MMSVSNKLTTSLMQRGLLVIIALAFGAVLLVSPVVASELTVPNSFSNGTAADADEVNSNFSAAKGAIDDNFARLPLVWASTDDDHGLMQVATYVDPIETNSLTITVPSGGVVTLSGSVGSSWNGGFLALNPYIDGSKVPAGNVYSAAYAQAGGWNTASYTLTVPILPGSHTISQSIVFFGGATNIQIGSNHLTVSFLPTAQSSYNSATP